MIYPGSRELCCTQCGRYGTRDFRIIRSTSQALPGETSGFVVCANREACQKRWSDSDGGPKVAPQVKPLAISPWGTLFFAAKVTPCPLCSATIHRTMVVVQTSWTKRVENGVERGSSDAVHLECAIRNGIRVDWSVNRVLGDLRRIIASIPVRRLRRTA